MAGTNSFVLYDLSDEAQQRIHDRFESYPTKGRNSPKQRWVKAQIYISLLEPNISEKAFSLWMRGLQIAQKQRGQIDLRNVSEINEKIYKDEEPQLKEIVRKFREGTATRQEVMYRLANILYYLVHIYAQTGGVSEFESNYLRFCKFASIPPLTAFSCAAKKMASRAEYGNDPEGETCQIERVLAELQTS